MSTLIRVELRKAVDTRAGFWLQATIGLLTLAVVVLYVIFAKGSDDNLQQFLSLAVEPAAILLPVVGILLVSSEWSQRTALVTFTLTPRRAGVFWSKLAAGLVIGLAAFVVCLIAAVIGNAASGGDWTLSAAVLGQMGLYVLTAMATGIGFGAAILSSAPAIVASFALPLAWTALGTIPFLHGVAKWVDQSRALAPLTDHAMSGIEWAHAAVALGIWMVVPLAIGFWRVTRGEV